ncbi:GntR family transcriptional regulator [Collinsella aerofaciens]|uniref:GntR family transcriptional regulator n=1 Tax=Collinsella aerofaciens TaxID=74426 RepID=UPI0021B4AF17|nr:GntR family transcriptional regulator [Collinsella aerofaciens]
MARAIFQTIYDNVKQSIDDGTYAYQSYLPSETELTQLFDCSRMTVRRAISMLAADGYVLPQQGKGMRVIRNISDETNRGGGGLETFKEIAASRGFELKTVTMSLSSSSATRRSPRLRGFLKAVSSRVPNASVMQTDGPCAPTTPIT